MKLKIIEKIVTPLTKDISLFDYIEGKPFEQIKEELGAEPLNIKVNDKGNLYICKYSQIDSDFTYLIVRQCRGIILEKDSNKVVAYPFSKFFNMAEVHADKVDFATASVQEKVDGSIIKVYYYDNKWNIATNGTIDSRDAQITDPMTGREANFYDLFHEGLEQQGITFPELQKQLVKGNTYIFELVHPVTRIVVKYEKPGVYLIGIRNNDTMKEVDTFDPKNELVKKLTDIGIKRPKTFSFASPEEMVAAAQELDANQEGFVVRDGEFRRVKIKGPLYVKMHYLKANNDLTPKHLVEMIQANETDEFLASFPEYGDKIEEVRQKIANYIKHIQSDWKDMFSAFGPDFKSRKDFADVAKKTLNSDAMFKALNAHTKGETDIAKFIHKYVMEMQTDKLVSAVGV